MAKKYYPVQKIADFNTSTQDARAILALTMQAVEGSEKLGIVYDARTVERDLTVCHLNIMRLDLEGMITTAREDEVIADVIGIHLNIDRHQLTLKNGFCPLWKTR